MKRIALRIIPMTRSHITACDAIVATSEPWKTLQERFDFECVLSQKNRPDNRALVCVMEKRAVGFIVFTPQPVFARGGYIRSIGVAPSMRRLGIGSKLLSCAEKIVAGCSPNLYLCVSSFNRKAQTFYKDCGYTRVGTLRDLIIPGASEYIYWKRLTLQTAARKKPQRTKPL